MTIDIRPLLNTVINKDISDLHLTVGLPPMVRLNSQLKELKAPKLTPDDTLNLMKSITSDRHQKELEEQGSTDFGFAFDDKARFRVAIFKQKGDIALALRLIPNKFFSMEDIGLPVHITNSLSKTKGLILVTGPTGSGKTTTLASMVNYINTEMDRHIITVEDPIEYYHPHKKSVVSQREIGVDVPSFSEAIKRGLRQDPDVILIGEMRDLETMHTALQAAETGHLVFGTLHTTGSARTISRMVDMFPVDQQEQVRTMLATSLEAVISQVLIPTVDGRGRVAAFEIMTMLPSIENLIRENKIFRIDSVIQTSGKHGMVLMDDYLFDLFSTGKIKHTDMMRYAQYPDGLTKKVVEAKAKKQ